MREKFSLKKRIKSFGYALNGVKILMAEEHNARIHFLISLIVIIAGFFFRISGPEWIMICFAIGFVIVTEALNSALEALADHVTPERHTQIKKVKDLAAFAVLFSALISAIIGLIIFLPKIIASFLN